MAFFRKAPSFAKLCSPALAAACTNFTLAPVPASSNGDPSARAASSCSSCSCGSAKATLSSSSSSSSPSQTSSTTTTTTTTTTTATTATTNSATASSRGDARSHCEGTRSRHFLEQLWRRQRSTRQASTTLHCHGVPTQTQKDLERLKLLIKQGRLLHPLEEGTANFTHLAQALSLCCGVCPGPPHSSSWLNLDKKPESDPVFLLEKRLGGQSRRHLVFVLCDGMGCSTLEEVLPASSFMRRHNEPNRLRAVFPSTTPAALTTLATGVWPGQHGLPGWELRDQKGCEFPCRPVQGPVQLTILAPSVTDMRSRKPMRDLGYSDADIFVQPPWTASTGSSRRMRFVSAFQGTGFTDWFEGPNKGNIGTIPEISMDTLGKPNCAEQAVEHFAQGIDDIIRSVKEAEEKGFDSYIYLYTAHPDKHMHALGVEAPEVHRIVKGFDKELERLWNSIRHLDASMVVTADHGHVTVPPEEMVSLPSEILACLDYANIGVHGKGRHGYLHCKSGRRKELEALWSQNAELTEKFLLLDVDDAAAMGLFGPEAPLAAVRPRLGDLVAISLGAATLCTGEEVSHFRTCSKPKCQGGHGSLLPDELRIPFICLP